jgi:hypothetical protein
MKFEVIAEMNTECYGYFGGEVTKVSEEPNAPIFILED